MLLPSLMETLWRQKSDLYSKFFGHEKHIKCCTVRRWSLQTRTKSVNFEEPQRKPCSTRDSSLFLPLLRWAACLSWRLRTLCLEERRTGHSGAADRSPVPQCPPWCWKKDGVGAPPDSTARPEGGSNGFTTKQSNKGKKWCGGVRLRFSMRWKRKQWWQRGNAQNGGEKAQHLSWLESHASSTKRHKKPQKQT